MVQAFSGEIRLVSVFREKGLHLQERGGFIVVTSDVHALDAESFIISKKLSAGKVCLFFRLSFPHCPVKLFFCYKFRETDHGDPPEAVLVSVVDPGTAHAQTEKQKETKQRRSEKEASK